MLFTTETILSWLCPDVEPAGTLSLFLNSHSVVSFANTSG